LTYLDLASVFLQLGDGRVQKLHLWTVQNWDADADAAAAAADGDHRNAVEAVRAVDVDISYFQESNVMAAAAYDNFDTDQKLQEDSAILAAAEA